MFKKMLLNSKTITFVKANAVEVIEIGFKNGTNIISYPATIEEFVDAFNNALNDKKQLLEQNEKEIPEISSDLHKELDEILLELKEYLHKNPDIRIGQILVNVADVTLSCPELYYMTNTKLLQKLKQWNSL
jgi:hypothetical protein